MKKKTEAEKDFDKDGEVESPEEEWKRFSLYKSNPKIRRRRKTFRKSFSKMKKEPRAIAKATQLGESQTKKDEDDPIDYEKKTKSGKREKIGGKVFEDKEGEETYRYGEDEGKDKKELDID